MWAEVVTPADEADDTSEATLVGMYSTPELADAARGRAEAALQPDERVAWTIEQVHLGAIGWETGFVDGTKK